MSWFYLFLAGLLEIGFTAFLKASENFTKLYPTLGFLFLGACSFSSLSMSLKDIPLGTAYAVWTGVGAFGTAILGIVWWGESMAFGRVFFLMLLIFSIVGLKLVSE